MTLEQQNQNPVETQDHPNYDRHMIDGETAARMEREGANFKQTPESVPGEPNNTSGYTKKTRELGSPVSLERGGKATRRL